MNRQFRLIQPQFDLVIIITLTLTGHDRTYKFETFFRTVAERGLAFMQRRLIASLTLTAEKRYEQFAEKYPDFLQRVPQFSIASYLGMTTQYLSRIRKKQTKS